MPDSRAPGIDFNTFVLSLSTSALMHLGEHGGHEGEANLAMAQHTIDCLEMLEEKTQGNLTGEEERLLHRVLTDVRLRFVKASGG